MFKIALPNQWLVIISGPEMVEDVRRRGGEEASFRESFDDVRTRPCTLSSKGLGTNSPWSQFFNIKYTTGRYPIDDGYHIDVIRERLMRGITAVLPDMVDELLLAIPTYIDPPNDSEDALAIVIEEFSLHNVSRLERAQCISRYGEDHRPRQQPCFRGRAFV